MKNPMKKSPPLFEDRKQNFLGDYTPARKMALDFSNAENPLGCSPKAVEAIQAHLSGIHHYPSPMSSNLVAALRSFYKLDQKNLDVLVTAGAGAGILLCVQALLRAGQNIVMPEATFPVALFGATTLEGRGRMVRMKGDLSIDLEALAAAVSFDTAFTFLCNPNNPTGEIIPVQTLFDFAENSQRPVVVSEANADYAGISALDRNDIPENLIVIRSFSKIHGLAGMRVGAVIAHPRMIRKLAAALCPFTVPVLSEAAAIAALNDRDHVQASLNFMEKQRRLLHYSLTSIGLHVLPSAANTMMVRIPDRFTGATAFSETLSEHGCTVIDGTSFCAAASRYIRISPRSAAHNTALVNILQQVTQ